MSAIPPVGPGAPIQGVTGIAGLGQAGAAGATQGTGFGTAIAKGLDAVASLEAGADSAVSAFAAGGDVQITDVMAATAKANLGMAIVNEIRTRGLEAYQQIINIQV